jgi:inhibitor of nuclear factor kappa-B kinase subunit alpha
MAADLNVSKSTMHNVLKYDLRCHAFKKRKVHGVSATSKQKRLERATLLLSRHAGEEFVFSDEKLFVLQQSHNIQNDRLWACSSRSIPDSERNIPRFQSAVSVMVWGGICKRGKLPLVFIEKGVKINAIYYKTEVLQKVVKPSVERMYGSDHYVFQQDGAPSHTANVVQNWCRANLSDFLAKDEWPPSSPDLNPLDYFVWSYMLSKINEHKVSTLAQFKTVILRVWDEMSMEVVRAACDGFEKRLKLVKKVKGGVIPKHML